MLQLIINSVLLGVGLAMDAFSISIANGIVEPGMRKRRMLLIAGVYAVFQFMMPMLGWLLVTTLEEIFTKFSILIPWIALILLLFIGGKMIVEAILEKKNGKKSDEEQVTKLTFKTLIIGVVTLVICLIGLIFGRKIGEKISGTATIIGGIILIVIGIEIFVKGVFGL